MRKAARAALSYALALAALPLLVAGAVVALARRRRPPARPRLLWGALPIKSLTYMSRAMREAGYESDTVAIEMYPIVDRDDFDHLALGQARAYLFFARALGRYDVFHYFFDGGVLQSTPLDRLELPFLKLLGRRVVVMPYGSDSFVLERIRDPEWREALLLDYPELEAQSSAIDKRIRRMSRHADAVIGTLVHVECLPHWDVLPCTYYPLDAGALQPRLPRTEGTARIAHAANHRGVKGTDFLVAAVEQLQEEGEDVELDLIERVPNAEALERIAHCDIYVDQLVFGYALAAMEGMALGKVVISPTRGNEHYELFREYSYLNECPIVSATRSDIHTVLRELLARREEWPSIGRRSREYVERRHSYGAAAELWSTVYRRIWFGEDVDLVNLYRRGPRSSTRTADSRGAA